MAGSAAGFCDLVHRTKKERRCLLIALPRTDFGWGRKRKLAEINRLLASSGPELRLTLLLLQNQNGHLMMIKRTIVSAVLAFAAGTASAADLPKGDSASARVFMELHSIQRLAGVLDPLLTVPGGSFRIIEGDFLALGNLRIRLVGIDAPEVAQQCNSAGGGHWECAAEAEDRIRDMLASAERVECFSNEQDSYGHYLASCKADGLDVGGLLVAEGLAWPDEGQGHYLSEAAQAQAASRGIWQAETPTPSEWRKDHN